MLEQKIGLTLLQTTIQTKNLKQHTMKRRHFLKAVGGVALMSQLPMNASAKEKENKKESAELPEITRITIPVGATKPFKALHISDTHLTKVDNRDNERKKELAKNRLKGFKNAEAHFDASIAHAQKNGMTLLHTGDLIDFVSDANLRHVKSKLEGVNCFSAAGNHEYSQYVGEAKEDEAYKAQSYDKVQAAYPNNLRFASRIINGVNFVAIDDVYYNFTKEHLALMKEEVKKGLPIVMMCHVPLYTPECYAIEMYKNKGRCAYVTGAPLELTETFECDPTRPIEEQWRNRSVQQRADKPTLDFIKWLKKQPLLKAILCGHCHEFYQGTFSPTAMQHMAGANYAGKATEIQFI